MRVINYFDSDRQSHWLNEIKRGDWGAAGFLYELLSKGTFFDAAGKNSKVLLLTDGDELISFCTYAEKDDIQPTEFTPWMGFVYTFPEHRGHHYVGLLMEEVEGRNIRTEDQSTAYQTWNDPGGAGRSIICREVYNLLLRE